MYIVNTVMHMATEHGAGAQREYLATLALAHPATIISIRHKEYEWEGGGTSISINSINRMYIIK